jgi:hypothetical protein
MSRPDQSNSDAYNKSDQEDKGVRVKSTEARTHMDLLIFGFLALAAISGGFLSVFSYLGYWRNKETWAIWALYCLIVFTVTAGFLSWQKRIWDNQAAVPATNNRARLSVKNAAILEAVRNPETNTATIIDAAVENTVKLKPGIIVVLQTVIENSGDASASEVRPSAFFGVLDSMLPEYPAYQGIAVSSFQSSQPLVPGRHIVVSSPVLMTDKEIAAIIDGQKFLVMFGFVDYLDGRTKRKMKFHYVYEPARLGMVAGPTHNQLDCDETKG